MPRAKAPLTEGHSPSGYESSATEETGATALVLSETKEASRSFLQVGLRALNEEELSSSAARRFLLYEIERLDKICAKSEIFIEKYHDQQVEIATLTEAGKISRWNEILSFICLSVGSAGIGAAPSYISVPGVEKVGWFILGLSVILVGAGIMSRVWK